MDDLNTGLINARYSEVSIIPMFFILIPTVLDTRIPEMSDNQTFMCLIV